MPKRHIARELTFVIFELGMGLIGLGLLRQGAIAHVLHTQSGGDDQHLIQRASLASFQNHSPHSRIQGQFGELLAQTRELIELIHGAEFIEELIPIGDGFGLGGLKESKALHVCESQRLHAQNHARKRASENFRIRVGTPRVEILLGIKTNANAVGDSPASPRSLIGRGL